MDASSAAALAEEAEEEKRELDTDCQAKARSEMTAFRSQIFMKFLEALSRAGSPTVNRVMHSIVMERAWEPLAGPIRELSVPELRQLKAQYKQYKEIKSRHITDMLGVLEVFGLLASGRAQAASGVPLNDETNGSEEDGQRDSTSVHMDVKFEEEPYEDEDWLLLLLSELIFDKLKLDKPEIALNYVPLICDDDDNDDGQVAVDKAQDEEERKGQTAADGTSSEPDLKSLLSRESATGRSADERFPLMDQLLMPPTARKALILVKQGLFQDAKDVLDQIKLSEDISEDEKIRA